MGIKFLCPNGHKLHVKAFLAGKKAICPKCGARVLVPAESQAPVSESSAPEDVTTQSTLIPLASSSAEQVFQPPAPAIGTPVEALTVAPPPPAVVADPLGEAPQAVWYVRPATGGQFGPASAEIMRSWLTEGRIGASSLVWRAPWPEWRIAANTFPELGTPNAPGPVTTNGAPPLPAGEPVPSIVEAPAPQPETPPAMEPLAEATRKRRRKNDVSLIASAVLVVISIILVIVLLLVFRAQGGGGEKKIEETPPADEETLI